MVKKKDSKYITIFVNKKDLYKAKKEQANQVYRFAFYGFIGWLVLIVLDRVAGVIFGLLVFSAITFIFGRSTILNDIISQYECVEHYKEYKGKQYGH